MNVTLSIDEKMLNKAALDLVRRCRREGSSVVSTQVLQEYFVVSTRKLVNPFS